MELGQLGHDDAGQTQQVDGEVERVVVGVGARQDEQQHGHDRQKLPAKQSYHTNDRRTYWSSKVIQLLPGGSVLDPMIKLLPMRQPPGRALIEGDPRMGLHLQRV